jgi:hypothetical protein
MAQGAFETTVDGHEEPDTTPAWRWRAERAFQIATPLRRVGG